MKNEYKLFNRDNLPVSLRQLCHNKYELVVDAPYEPMFNVSKLGNEYVYIDPPGGPLISRGGFLPDENDVVVERIYYDEEHQTFVCELKEVKYEQQNNN